jgi:hypothetical protein
MDGHYLETPVPRVNMLIVNFFPHMITILALVQVFHFKYFCFTRARISKACLFYSLSSKKPPATGTPTPKYLRHNKICECKYCHDYKCPYFHQSLPTLPLASATPQSPITSYQPPTRKLRLSALSHTSRSVSSRKIALRSIPRQMM